MGKVAQRLARIRLALEPAAHIALERSAREAEDIAKEIAEDFWLDDTGSARASITGWNPKLSRHDKNFDDTTWRAAQAGLIKSKYPWNAPENYRPQVESEDQEEEFEAYLSMFVKYAPDIAPTFAGGEQLAVEAFKDTMKIMEGRLLSITLRELARALTV